MIFDEKCEKFQSTLGVSLLDEAYSLQYINIFQFIMPRPFLLIYLCYFKTHFGIQQNLDSGIRDLVIKLDFGIHFWSMVWYFNKYINRLYFMNTLADDQVVFQNQVFCCTFLCQRSSIPKVNFTVVEKSLKPL